MGSLEGTFDTKLHEAVRYGDIEEVKNALQQGYDVNLIGLYQWSALHEAAYNGEEEILQLLLKHKGDPNKGDLLRGCTAVHYAAREGHVTCLRLLIKSGGCYDITNKDGETALDLAADECQDLLKSLKSENPTKVSVQRENNDLQLELKRPDTPEAISLGGASVTDSVSECDIQSIEKTHIKTPVLGYLQLSFEYHAKKKSLKIRVWQLSDLLLPPPNSSTVHSIYVKSFLMPDKKRDSKRKTEEVRVDSADTHLHIKKGGNRGSIQHVYSPATFKFSKPLEYSDISKEIVKDKSVQLEVCINQRYSKRSFLIGLYHIPLSSAVKKIVRDKYPVIPCVNPTIPTSMKVYNASQLTITNSAKIFYSNPNLRNTSLSSISNGSDRAISDPDFSIDIAYNQSISPSTSIELDEISDEEEKTLHDFCKRGTKLKSSHSNEARVIIPDTAVCKHSVDSNHETLKCVVDLMSSDSDKKMKLSAFSQVSENNDIRHSETFKKNASKHCQVLVGEAGTFESLQDDLNEKKQMIKVVGNEQEEKNPVGSNSRPETPTWDYYDMEMSAVEIPLQEVNTSANKDGSLAVYLPMETTLGLKTERRSKKGHVKHKKQKERTPVPGHVVPIIVVTPDDGADARFKDRNGEKSRQSKLTSDVFINMEFAAEDNPTRNVHTKPLKGESQLEVTADVHIDAVCRLNSETSIEIGDSDSFIIDLEENEDVTNENSNIQSKLAGGSAVPMTVFIDESCDSCDDVLVTGAVHSSHRFALNQNKDEHVSEV